jgi:nucleoside-diphosphate-sugar epimerase
VSVSEIAAVAARLAGRDAPRALPPWIPRLLMPYQTRFVTLRLSLSNAAARAELGWRPMYPTVEDGLSRTFLQSD